MKADNITPIIHVYKPIKVNKTSTIFEYLQTHENRPSTPDDYFTTLVKIEQYQGYSKAYNLSHYFRIRNTTNWSKCKTPTGLFKTIKSNLYYGNILSSKGKTLILFHFDNDDVLRIYKYQNGFYPKRKQLDLIINKF